MTKRLRLSLIIALFATFGIGILVSSQSGSSTPPRGTDACPALIEQALTQIENECSGLGRNVACYGYNRVEADFSQTVPDDFFTSPGEIAELRRLAALRTSPLSLLLQEWGIALMNVQANVPNTVPGQAVTFILLGDMSIEDAVEPSSYPPEGDTLEVTTADTVMLRGAPRAGANVVIDLPAGTPLFADALSPDRAWVRVGDPVLETGGWVERSRLTTSGNFDDLVIIERDMFTPMQAFYFSTGIGRSVCEEAPNALIVQGPERLTIDINANGADVRVSSTVMLRSVGDGSVMQLIVLGGKATINPDTPDEQTLETLETSFICLDEAQDLGFQNGEIDDRVVPVGCEWEEPRELTDAEILELLIFERIPPQVLNYPIDIPDDAVPPTPTPTPVSIARIFGTAADVSINKRISNPTPNVGDAITYTVTATNVGSATANGIQVTDILPGGLTLDSVLSTQGIYNPNSGIWSIGTLTAGSQASLTFTVIVNAGTEGQTLVNTASLTAINADSNAANDSSSVALTVQTPPSGPPPASTPEPTVEPTAEPTVEPSFEADIALNKSVSNPTPAEGDTVTYTLSVTNNGTDVPSNVTVTDVLPAGVTLASTPVATQGTYDTVSGIWTVGALAVDSTATLTLTVTIDSGTANTAITNNASAGSELTDPNTANNGASATLNVCQTFPNPIPAGDVAALIAALTAANNTACYSGGTTINLTNSVYSIGAIHNTIDGANGLPSIANNITIVGNGATIERNSSSVDDFRLFHVASTGALTLNNMTLDNGSATVAGGLGSHGGAILVNQGVLNATGLVFSNNVANNAGGAIYSGSTLSINTTTFSNNIALGNGGAIANMDQATLLNSTLYLNDATGAGGGIYNEGTFSIVNSTFSSNFSADAGGGIANVGSGILNMSFATIADNATTLANGGNGLYNEATLNVRNSIIANNGGDDCAGAGIYNAGGTNFTTEADCTGFTVTTSANLNLGVLGNNGGSTQTYVPSLPSVAIDSVGAAECTVVGGTALTRDQRGIMRPIDGDNNGTDLCDVGATEIQASSIIVDLALTKAEATTGPYNVGDTVTFQLDLINEGSEDATGVIVTDLLPAGLTYDSDTPSAGIYDSATGEWSLGSLPTASVQTLTLNAMITTDGSITNVAEITSINQMDTDSTPGNNDPAEDDYGAVTITVCAPIPNPVTTVAEFVTAINLANDGGCYPGADIINLQSGATFVFDTPVDTTYGNTALPAITSEITLVGNGATLDTFTEIFFFRHLYVAPTGTLSLSDLTLANGYAQGGNESGYGGSIYNEGVLNAVNVVFSNNRADELGGALLNNGTAILDNVLMQNNRSFAVSGGDFVNADTSNSVIAPQLTLIAAYGGGAIFSDGNLTLSNATLSNNQSDDRGGAVIISGGNASISDTTFDMNLAASSGGSLANYANTTLERVTAKASSGDSAFYNEATLVFTNSTIANNNTPVNGALDLLAGTTTLNNVTLVNNERSVLIGPGASVDMRNTIVASDASANCVVNGTLNDSGANFDTDGTCASGASNSTVTTVTPAQLNLGVLANNTGPTETIALVSPSVAIDAVTGGDCTTVGGAALTIDQRGITRPIDGDAVPGALCDAGAFEAGAASIADLSLTKTVNNAAPVEGEQIDFTITVQNSGPDAANVTVSDLLPAGLTYISDDASGAYDSGTGIWNVGNLPASNNAILTIAAQVDIGTAGNVITNIAEVQTSDAADPNASPGNGDNTEDDYDEASVTVQVCPVITDPATPTTVTELIEAISAFNNESCYPGPNHIDLPVGGATFTLTAVDNVDPAVGDNALPVIDSEIIINGNDSLIDTSVAARLFYVIGGMLTLNDLELANGNANTAAAARGGTVYNDGGVVNLNRVYIRNSNADASGGAIYNESGSTLTVQQSAITNSFAATGGAIFNDGDASLVNSTIYLNNATTGGGIVQNAGTINLSFVTLHNNGSFSSGKNLHIIAGTVNAKHVLSYSASASPHCQNIGGSLNVAGVNFDTDGSCTGFTQTTLPELNFDPAGAQLNGATTPTVAIVYPSVAIDAVGGADCTAFDGTSVLFDQRGISRPLDGDEVAGALCDAGAFEAPDIPIADLSIMKSVDDGTPFEGDTVDFTITVQNDGPDAANITVIDLLPSGLTYVSDDASGGYDSGTGIWNVGNMPASSNAVLTITAQVDGGTSGTTITNVTEVETSDADDPDSTPGNTVTTEDDYAEAPITVQTCGLIIDPVTTVAELIGAINTANDEVNCGVGPDIINLQGGTTFTLTSVDNTDPTVGDTALPVITSDITLNGNDSLIEVDGTLNARIFFVDGGTLTVNDLDLSNGKAQTGSSQIGGTLINNASTVNLNRVDIVNSLANNSGGAIYNAVGGSLALDQVLISGSTSSQNGGAIFNAGGLTLTNVTLANNQANNGGGIYNNGTTTLSFTTLYENDATTNGANLFNAAASGVNAKDNVSFSTSATSQCSNAGFIVTLGTNYDTDGSCTNFTQTTSADLNLDPAGLTPGGNTQTVPLLFPSVLLDASADCTNYGGFSVTVDQRGVSRPIDGDGDAAPACDVGAHEAPVPPSADLSISKIPTVDAVFDGDIITYQIDVINGGPDDATGVVVQETVPAELTYMSDDSSGAYDFSTGLWDIGTIVSGGTATINIQYMVTNTYDYNTLVNIAEIIASNAPDPDSTPNNGPVGFTEDDYTEYGVSMCTFPDPVTTAEELRIAITRANDPLCYASPVTINVQSGAIFDYSTNIDNTFGFNIFAPITGDITIEGNGSTLNRTGAQLMRFFYIGGGGSLTLNDITINNGHATGNATNGRGAGIFVDSSGQVLLNSVTLSNNAAAFRGGGVFVAGGGSLTASTGTLFDSNSALDSGGGIAADGGSTVNLTGVTMQNNSTQVTGGAVYNRGNTTITDSVLNANHADGNGGAVFNAAGTLTITTTTLTNNTNTASFGGNGAALFNEAAAEIYQSLFTANVADGAGGAIYNSLGTLLLENSTLYENAGNTGAGALVNDAVMDIFHATIVDNQGGTYQIVNTSSANMQASLIANVYGSNCPAPLNSLGYNLSDNNGIDECGFTNVTDANVMRADLNLDTGLMAAGGPTQTLGISLPSVAIDNVPAAMCSVLVDQRGVSRPVDGDGDVTADCDTGAFEAGAAPFADLSLTKTVDDTIPRENNTFVYTLEVTNNGPNTATNVVVRDVLPADLTYDSDDGGADTSLVSNTLDWTIPSLNNGQSVQLNITMQASGDGVVSLDYLNTAEIIASDQIDPDDTFGDGTGEDYDEVSIRVCPFVADPVNTTIELITALNAFADTTCFPGPNVLTIAPNSFISLFVVDNVLDGSNVLPLITYDLTINGQGSVLEMNAANGRFFRVNAGNTLNLNNLTLRNGVGDAVCGGAIFNFGTTNLTNVRFEGNSVAANLAGGAICNAGTLTSTNTIYSDNFGVANTRGGAIYNGLNAVAIIDGNRFSNNGAANGGAIYNDSNADVTINNTDFAQNTSSTHGGAIYNFAAIANIGTSTFVGNTSSNNGGAIFNQNFSDLIIATTRFASNNASGSGGAIFNDNGIVDISGSVFTQNGAIVGGAILNQGPSGDVTLGNTSLNNNNADNGAGLASDIGRTVIIKTSSINNNFANDDGGGVYISNTDFYTENTTYSSNFSGANGGGLYLDAIGNETMQMNFITVADNTATTGKGLWAAISPSAIAQVTNSIIAENGPDDCAILGPMTISIETLDTSGTCGGATTVTSDVLLLDFLSNGVNVIDPGSAAIDRVPAASCTDLVGSSLTFDQQGNPRPTDGDGDSVSDCDVGAYEASLPAIFADLELTQTITDPAPNPGQTVDYILTVTNNGPTSPVNSVRVRDVLPEDVTFNGASGTGTYDPDTGIWDVGSVATGSPVTMSLNVTFNAGTQGRLVTNEAEIIRADTFDNALNNNLTVTNVLVNAGGAISVNTNTMTVADEGLCSLVEAITAANTDTASGILAGECVPAGGADTILLDAAGPYNFTSTDNNTFGATALPVVTSGITIVGNAHTLTTSIGIRFFVVNSGSLTLNDMVLDGGSAVNGGAIRTNGAPLTISDVAFFNNSASGVGGAIHDTSGATINIHNAWFRDNSASGDGGAISTALLSTMNITATTFEANTTFGVGGAIHSTGILNILNSTFSSNQSTFGGAIFHSGSGGLIDFATIADNSAFFSTGSNEGGAFVNFGTLTVRNSLIVRNQSISTNCDGSFNDGGNMVADDISCGTNFTPQQINLANSLEFNGGLTFTYALNYPSVAIDRVGACSPSFDQRRFPRPVDGDGDTVPGCDVGAFETDAPVAADLGINISVNTMQPNEGDLILITLDLSNNGPSEAKNILSQVPLPSQVSFSSDTGGIGNDYNDEEGFWTVDRLPANGTVQLIIAATVNDGTAGASPSLSAGILSASVIDNNPSNDSAATFIDIQDSNVAIIIGGLPDMLRPGEVVTLNTVVTNQGPNAATNLVVEQPLPTGLSLMQGSASQGTYDAVSGIWQVGNLAVGAQATLTLEGVFDADRGEAMVTARVVGADQGDSDMSDNTFTRTVIISDATATPTATATQTPTETPLPEITAEVTPDATVEPSITPTETLMPTETATATETQTPSITPTASATLTPSETPEGHTPTTPAPTVTPSETVAPSETPTASETPTFTPTETPTFTPTWTATATPTHTATDVPTATPSNTPTFTPTLAPTLTPTFTPTLAPTLTPTEIQTTVDIGVSVNVDAIEPVPGGRVNVVLTVTNSGVGDATNLVIALLKPAEMVILADDGNGAFNSTTTVWRIAALPAGGSATLTLFSAIHPDTTVGASVTYNAHLVAVDQVDVDSVPDNLDTSEDDWGMSSIKVAPALQSDAGVAPPISDPQGEGDSQSVDDVASDGS